MPLLYLCVRVAIGDLYFLTADKSFICRDFLCLHRGFEQNYVFTKRYACPSHPLPEKLYTSVRASFVETPSIIGSLLFVMCPGYLLVYLIKQRNR